MENNEAKKPAKLFQIGENDSGASESDEDTNLDKKIQSIDKANNIVPPPVYTTPAFNVPVYNAPSYPGPPGFNPTIVPATVLPTATGLTPPTFTY